jgi:hypothetical protein
VTEVSTAKRVAPVSALGRAEKLTLSQTEHASLLMKVACLTGRGFKMFGLPGLLQNLTGHLFDSQPRRGALRKSSGVMRDNSGDIVKCWELLRGQTYTLHILPNKASRRTSRGSCAILLSSTVLNEKPVL